MLKPCEAVVGAANLCREAVLYPLSLMYVISKTVHCNIESDNTLLKQVQALK